MLVLRASPSSKPSETFPGLVCGLGGFSIFSFVALRPALDEEREEGLDVV